MNKRERFLATAKAQPVDRTFLLAPWAWGSTIKRWRREGLPENANLVEYFETDWTSNAPVAAQGRYVPHIHPPLERKVLSQTDEFSIIRDEEENVVKLFNDDPTQPMPQWIEYPMKDRHDWEEVIKPRFDAKIPGRCPQGEYLEKYANDVADRDYPLGSAQARVLGRKDYIKEGMVHN